MAGLVAAWTVAGVFALIVAALLVIDLPWGRRLAVRELDAMLAREFKGRIVVESVGSLGLGGVAGANARIEAPDGTVVLRARGASARIAPVAILRSLLGHGDLHIHVFDVDVDSLEAVVDGDASGALKLQKAFDPAQPPPANPPPGRGLLLEFPHVTLRHGWVHGTPPGAVPVDADLDGMTASIRVPPGGMAIDLTEVRLSTRGMPRGADVLGRVEAHLAMPSKTGASMGVAGAFDGDVGGVATKVRGSMDGERIDAVLDVFDAVAERLKAMVPAIQPEHPLSAHAEAHGPLSALAISLHAGSGAARIDAGGKVSVRGKMAATLHVDARHVDVHALVPSGPASDLNAGIDLDAAQSYTGLCGADYAVAIAPSTVAAQALPALTLRGRLDQRTDGAYADVASSTFELPMALGRGRASIQASGTVTTVGPTTVDARAQVALEKLFGYGVKVEAAHLEAHATGTTADPRIEAGLEAQGLRAGGYEFQRATATVDGSLAHAHVTAALLADRSSSLRVQATVGLAGGVEVAPAEVALWRGDDAMHAHVDRVATVPGGLDVDGLVVTGVGAPLRTALHLRPGAVTVKADTNGIDLAKIGWLLGLQGTLRRGTAAFVVDLAARPNGIDGTAVLDMNDGCFWRIDGLTGHFDTRMAGRDVVAALSMRATGVGTLDADHVHLRLAGAGPLEQASWRDAWGDAHVQSEFDLARVIDLLPPNVGPLAGTAGRIALEGGVHRAAGAASLPDVTLSLRTTKLSLAARSAPDQKVGETVLVAAPQVSQAGLDLAMDLEADGPHGTGKVSARVIDAHGVLVRLDADSPAIPYKAIASGTATTSELLRLPLDLKVVMSERRLDQLPDFMRVDGARGNAAFTLSFQGTASDPRLDAQAQVKAVQLIGSRDQPPFDAHVDAKYDGETADVTALARGGGKDLLHATARMNAKVADFVGGRSSEAWDASASARLAGFPLAAVPMLSDHRVRGTASGDLELSGLHHDARARMQIAVADLRVGKQAYGQIQTRFDYDGKAGHAGLVVDQGDGHANADADVALRWGAALAPSPDPSGTSRAVLEAANLRLGFLAPFLQSALDSLDGKLNADAHVTLAPGQKPEMAGTVTLDEGVVGLAALGQELSHVKARVVLTPDGNVRLQDASATGTSGKMTLAGTAHLDGIALANAQVDLQILKRDALPLDVEGTDIGAIYGKVSVKMNASSDGKAVTVAVDVPSLHVQLPDETPHGVEELGDPPPHDHVGLYTSPQRFVALPLDAREAGAQTDVPSGHSLSVGVHLGDIQIARGTDVRVGLGGDLTAKIDSKTAVTGAIALKQGKLDVQGKTFEIESGTVTFAADPANPEVNVTAGWTAEDGTRVYADYVGPIKTGKVTLRSDPARPQNEIVALILFGTADGSESTPYQSEGNGLGTGAQAGTAVGGFATGGLSKGLDKLTGMDITAKIDTSQANPRPEVEMQVARNISLELAVVLGTIPPGTNPDNTYATVDWRFHRYWSLAATFGDMGSTIADVVWRRRY